MNMDGQNRQEVAAYKITQFLTDELTKYNDYGAEGSDLNGTVLPESVTRRQVVQGRDGRWRENHITETDPIKNPLKIISDYQKNSDQVVQDYTDYAAVYDTDMYNYNVQINQKKQLILDTVSAAVAYGCSTSYLTFNWEGDLFTIPIHNHLVLMELLLGMRRQVMMELELVKQQQQQQYIKMQ